MILKQPRGTRPGLSRRTRHTLGIVLLASAARINRVGLQRPLFACLLEEATGSSWRTSAGAPAAGEPSYFRRPWSVSLTRLVICCGEGGGCVAFCKKQSSPEPAQMSVLTGAGDQIQPAHCSFATSTRSRVEKRVSDRVEPSARIETMWSFSGPGALRVCDQQCVNNYGHAPRHYQR